MEKSFMRMAAEMPAGAWCGYSTSGLLRMCSGVGQDIIMAWPEGRMSDWLERTHIICVWSWQTDSKLGLCQYIFGCGICAEGNCWITVGMDAGVEDLR